ncbi:tRNA methyltransferase ppm2 [Orbilia blumenaviensis]|uniref:tRNA wybutosine-synthesizing protein 4 n=1 Tax=Orbilia blumenaviensis TaxID=1796055 RepID=A0AAV9VP98_9PEZI
MKTSVSGPLPHVHSPHATVIDNVIVPDAVVATNDSSIVSKRSVERFYVPNRSDHLLRHFVPKFQRRSPLINRGYWLRMELVKQAVEDFLISKSDAPKYLINLGCGSDPLPFHYLRQYPDVNFIDVDYPQSIRRKTEVIKTTPELCERLVDPVYFPDSDTVMVSSANYTAIGIDLSDLDKFSEVVQTYCQAHDELLFISEVAITYMPVGDADSLIEWASRFSSARFVLIEQILPAGEKHPFAKTMLSHFRKINSALQTIGRYPSLIDQARRFHSSGWNSLVACDFYGAWCNMLSDEQRAFVESIEPFDEWEDFVYFGQHYFFLYACSRSPDDKLTGLTAREWSGGSRITAQELNEVDQVTPQNSRVSNIVASFEYRRHWQPVFDRRKHGAVARLGDRFAVYYGGADNKTRSSATHFFDEAKMKISRVDSDLRPDPRVCHSLTKLSGRKMLLVGGRGNPSSALVDCWLFNGTIWTRVHDLPSGRYRHSATHVILEGNDHVLIFGGRGANNNVYDTWAVWSELNGWSEVTSVGKPPTARFSASLAWFNPMAIGVLTGGFCRDGNMVPDILLLSFDKSGSMQYKPWQPCISDKSLLYRGGAQLIPISDTDAILAGGVFGLHCPSADIPGSFLHLDIANKKIAPLRAALSGKDQELWPVLVGCDYAWLNNRLHVFGGGINVFSMGSFWNLCTGILKIDHLEAAEPSPSSHHAQLSELPSAVDPTNDPPKPMTVQVYTLNYDPAVIQSEIRQYLKASIGGSREVTVHRAVSADEHSLVHLNFNSKNFKYQQMDFSAFIDLAFAKEPTTLCYLRSVSRKPTKHASLFSRDFPGLSADFYIPKELSFIESSLHSSPLRISSPGIGIWLHYDVCANFLFHIRGEKRLLLFPPSDIGLLQFPAGKTTSSILNIFEEIPSGTHPLEILMRPGDTLFIPPFWLHAVLPLSPCVAINTFFHSFDTALHSEGKDLYGNKDLACYEESREILKGVARKFDGVDENTRRFYLARLGQELLDIAADTV